MFREGDDLVFRAMSQPGCDFCERSLADFESIWGDGGSANGGSGDIPGWRHGHYGRPAAGRYLERFTRH